MMLELLQALWSQIGNVVAFLAGTITTHLLSRFRKRLIHLPWTFNVQAFARSATGPGLGRIEITHNGQPAENLFVATAQVTNESMQDVSDLELAVGLRDESIFLQHSARVKESLKFLDYSDDYAKRIDQYGRTPQEERTRADLDFIMTNREFSVPALNRGQSIVLWFLIHAPTGVYPMLLLSTEHVGVKLRQRPPRKETWGVRDDYAAAVGLLVGLIGIISLGLTDRTPLWSSLGFYLLGASAIQVGLLLIHAWRLVVRLIG